MNAPSLPQFHQANMDAMKQALQAGQSDFFNFAKNSVTYLYLLPPWSERGHLARMVREAFLGKHGKHVCWHSYEVFGKPDLGRKDPVVNALFECYDVLSQPQEVKRMLPNKNWYANVIIDGVMELDESGQQKKEYEAEQEANQRICRFTDKMWRELYAEISKPDVGCPYDPANAVCLIVRRLDAGNAPTKYEIMLAGENDARSGHRKLSRTNLYERFSQDKVVEIVTNLNDLDAQWPLPEESAFADAEKLAAKINAELRGGSVSASMAPHGQNFGGNQNFTPPAGMQGMQPGNFGPPPNSPGHPGSAAQMPQSPPGSGQAVPPQAGTGVAPPGAMPGFNPGQVATPPSSPNGPAPGFPGTPPSPPSQ